VVFIFALDLATAGVFFFEGEARFEGVTGAAGASATSSNSTAAEGNLATLFLAGVDGATGSSLTSGATKRRFLVLDRKYRYAVHHRSKTLTETHEGSQGPKPDPEISRPWSIREESRGQGV